MFCFNCFLIIGTMYEGTSELQETWSVIIIVTCELLQHNESLLG